MNRHEYIPRAYEFASRGEARPNAKMNADRVRIIRENKYGFTARQFAKMYDCHYRTIEKVRQFETWIHIK